jgi:hypothetical protein
VHDVLSIEPKRLREHRRRRGAITLCKQQVPPVRARDRRIGIDSQRPAIRLLRRRRIPLGREGGAQVRRRRIEAGIAFQGAAVEIDRRVDLPRIMP